MVLRGRMETQLRRFSLFVCFFVSLLSLCGPLEGLGVCVPCLSHPSMTGLRISQGCVANLA